MRSELEQEAKQARARGEYARAGEWFLGAAHDEFAGLWRNNDGGSRAPNPLDVSFGLEAACWSALCYRRADADRLAEISADHGLLVIEWERERDFPVVDGESAPGAHLIYPAVANEWVGHFRTITAEHPDGTAYETANEQYQRIDDTLSLGNRAGWAGEVVMANSIEMISRICDATGYMDQKELHEQLHGDGGRPSFTTRITAIQEHMPALVEHAIDNEEWHTDD